MKTEIDPLRGYIGVPVIGAAILTTIAFMIYVAGFAIHNYTALPTLVAAPLSGYDIFMTGLLYFMVASIVLMVAILIKEQQSNAKTTRGDRQ